jgi:serine/threonine protein phosphatase PrpC
VETVNQNPNHPADLLELQSGMAVRSITQTESGDQHLFCLFPGGGLAAVADGLGHGEKAAIAAETAMSVLQEYPQEPVQALMQRCHDALRKTRGAVLSLASFSAPPPNSNGTPWHMTWLGVGNVKGVLLRANSAPQPVREWLVPRGGVVGYQLPNPHPATFQVLPGDMLIFATDGLHSNFMEGINLAAFQSQPNPAQALADDILARSIRGTDDALVLVVQLTKKILP